MANIYVTEQYRETDDGLLAQLKEGVKTLLLIARKAIYEVEYKKIPENETKQKYDAGVSTVPIMRLQ